MTHIHHTSIDARILRRFSREVRSECQLRDGVDARIMRELARQSAERRSLCAPGTNTKH